MFHPTSSPTSQKRLMGSTRRSIWRSALVAVWGISPRPMIQGCSLPASTAVKIVRTTRVMSTTTHLLLGLLLALGLVLALRPRRRRPSWVIAELDRKAQQPYVPPESVGPMCHYSADVDPVSGPLIRR